LERRVVQPGVEMTGVCKMLITIWTPTGQLVCSDLAEWCFLATIQVSHKILHL